MQFLKISDLKAAPNDPENYEDLVDSWDKSIDSAREKYGENSSPVLAQTLGKYYAVEKYSIFSKIDEIKSKFIINGGADKIVEKVQSSLIKFADFDTSEEQEILFLSSTAMNDGTYSRETVIAATLYLLYVCKTIESKYREIRSARSKLVRALTAKNLRPENLNNSSPTDLKNKDSELSELVRLKKELKSLPEKFQYLNNAPAINPDLKIYEDVIPEFFPKVQIHKVYLAASLEFDEREFEKFSKLSLSERQSYANESFAYLPDSTWRYWQNDIENLFEPHFKI